MKDTEEKYVRADFMSDLVKFSRIVIGTELFPWTFFQPWTFFPWPFFPWTFFSEHLYSPKIDKKKHRYFSVCRIFHKFLSVDIRWLNHSCDSTIKDFRLPVSDSGERFAQARETKREFMVMVTVMVMVAYPTGR